MSNSMQQEQEKNKELFERLPVPKAVAAMAIPTVISQLIVLIYNMADTFYIGRTGNPMMVAGVSLILPIFNICIAFSSIAGTGGGTLMSRLLGADRPEDARSVATFSVLFSLASGLFFSILTALFMDPLLLFLGANEETLLYAEQYCSCVIVIGAAPTILSMTMANLLRNAGCSKQAGAVVSMGGILNIILDPLFMFVLLPKGYEILGVGIATTISNFTTCIVFLIIIHRLHNPILTFSVRDGLPDLSLLGPFFGVGLPAALGPFLFDLDYIVIDKLMANHSNIALAAIGIVLKVERFPLNAGIGLCLGMVPLAAYNYSARNLDRMDAILRFTRNVGILISLVSIALYEIFAPQIIRFFIPNPETIALGTDFLRIRALATIMMFLSFIYVHFFQAVGSGRNALLLIVMRWLAINIPMLFLLDWLFGMYGVAWSQLVSDVLVALLTYLIFYRYRKHILPAEMEKE